MSSFRVRPRFTQLVEGDSEEVRHRLVRCFTAEAGRFEVKDFEGFVCLRMAEERRRFWTPRLTLGLYGQGDGVTRIEGVYGPSANVWSIFLYAYLLSGLVAMFSGLFGLAQWLVGEPVAWGLWICTAALLVVTGLYVFAQVGQKLGARDTFELHLAYERAVGENVRLR